MQEKHAIRLLDRRREREPIARGTIGKREPLEQGVQPGQDLDFFSPCPSAVRVGRVCWPIELPCLILIASGASSSNMASSLDWSVIMGQWINHFHTRPPGFPGPPTDPPHWFMNFAHLKDEYYNILATNTIMGLVLYGLLVDLLYTLYSIFRKT